MTAAGKPLAFSRAHRITKRNDFALLRKDARKRVFRHWVLFYLPNELGHARLALSIGTKYGNSVRRNRYRRWLRESFRKNKAELPALDLHFVARQKPAKLPEKSYIQELNEDFAKLLHWLH